MIFCNWLKARPVTIHHVSDRQERKGYEAKIREITQKLDALAEQPNASLDVYRAFKASVMARNMDLGTAYQIWNYAQRILAISQMTLKPTFWFGFGLSEGGGQRGNSIFR